MSLVTPANRRVRVRPPPTKHKPALSRSLLDPFSNGVEWADRAFFAAETDARSAKRSDPTAEIVRSIKHPVPSLPRLADHPRLIWPDEARRIVIWTKLTMNDRGKRNLIEPIHSRRAELRRGVRFWVSFWPLPPPRRRETLSPVDSDALLPRGIAPHLRQRKTPGLCRDVLSTVYEYRSPPLTACS